MKWMFTNRVGAVGSLGVVGLLLAAGLSACGDDSDGDSTAKLDNDDDADDSADDSADDVTDDDDDVADDDVLLDDVNDDDTDPDAGAPLDCGREVLGSDKETVNILLVVDKSASMNRTPAGFEQNKWESMKLALAESLGAEQDHLVIGLEFFPFSAGAAEGETQCLLPAGSELNVEVGPASSTLEAIGQAFEDSLPDGGTPTAAALARALDYFTTGAGASLQGKSYVLLATDGGPNCNSEHAGCEADTCTLNLDGLCPDGVDNCCADNLPDGPANCIDDDPTVAAVAALAAEDIPTFVVGIPGSEQYAGVLDAMAEAGGVPASGADAKYFAVDDSGVDGLIDVFDQITTSLVTECRLQLESDRDTSRINIEVDGELVPQEDNWTVDTTTDPPTVELLGSLCEQIETEGAESVTITFGCPTVKVAK